MTQVPVSNAGLKYCNGLEISRNSSKKVDIAAGACRDSSNTVDMILSSTVTIDGTKTGANGVDLAALAADKFYAVYVIGDSGAYKDEAGLLSLDDSQPSLPFGYDVFRRVGWILTSSGSDVLEFHQYGSGQLRSYYYDVGISELSAGSATSYTDIDLATSVPPIATVVYLDLDYTPNAATNVAHFLPQSSSATDGIVRVGTGVAGAQVVPVEVPCSLDSGVPKVRYKVSSSDSLDVKVVGYKDELL